MTIVTRYNHTVDLEVFAFQEGNYATGNYTVNADKIAADQNGDRQILAGSFLASTDFGSTVRYLPRAVLSAATAGSASSLTVANDRYLFAGDVLTIVEPTHLLTYSSVGSGDSTTITIAGQAITVTSATTTIATFASAIATAINSDVRLARIVRAASTAGSVRLFAKDGVSCYTVAATVTGGTLAVSGGSAAVMQMNVAVGTISSINYATNVVTLASGSAPIMPIGTNVGMPCTDIYGIDPIGRDFRIKSRQDVAVFLISSGVRINFLPYFDDTLRTQLNRINFITKS